MKSFVNIWCRVTPHRSAKAKSFIATVKGDIHDIGKNIVKVLLENYGYDVIDLGKDVEYQAVVDAVRENDVKLVGLSALMTTTLVSRKRRLNCFMKMSWIAKLW